MMNLDELEPDEEDPFEPGEPLFLPFATGLARAQGSLHASLRS